MAHLHSELDIDEDMDQLLNTPEEKTKSHVLFDPPRTAAVVALQSAPSPSSSSSATSSTKTRLWTVVGFLFLTWMFFLLAMLRADEGWMGVYVFPLATTPSTNQSAFQVASYGWLRSTPTPEMAAIEGPNRPSLLPVNTYLFTGIAMASILVATTIYLLIFTRAACKPTTISKETLYGFRTVAVVLLINALYIGLMTFWHLERIIEDRGYWWSLEDGVLFYFLGSLSLLLAHHGNRRRSSH